jgi:hypothetical protein
MSKKIRDTTSHRVGGAGYRRGGGLMGGIIYIYIYPLSVQVHMSPIEMEVQCVARAGTFSGLAIGGPFWGAEPPRGQGMRPIWFMGLL